MSGKRSRRNLQAKVSSSFSLNVTDVEILRAELARKSLLEQERMSILLADGGGCGASKLVELNSKSRLVLNESINLSVRNHLIPSPDGKVSSKEHRASKVCAEGANVGRRPFALYASLVVVCPAGELSLLVNVSSWPLVHRGCSNNP